MTGLVMIVNHLNTIVNVPNGLQYFQILLTDTSQLGCLRVWSPNGGPWETYLMLSAVIKVPGVGGLEFNFLNCWCLKNA